MRTLRWCNDADLWQKERSALSLLPLLQRLKRAEAQCPVRQHPAGEIEDVVKR